jgi:hypothetical protein
MQVLYKIITFFLLLSGISEAVAAEQPSIYQASVPIATRSDQDRDAATKVALSQVLVKVSGNSHLLDNNAALKNGLAHADDYVEEFSYSSPPHPPTATPLVMLVRFDKEAVNKLVRDAGAPVWGQSRPLIMVWIAYEVPNHPADIVDSADTNIQVLFKDTAGKRGLPVVFPTMDASELTKITPVDVINQSLEPLQAASQRYGSNAILLGHLTQGTANDVTSQWTLTMGDDHWEWTIAGKNADEVIANLVNNISDTLAKRFATVMTNPVSSRITLKVTGLKQQTDLSEVINYLQQLSSVADVQLKSVNGTEVELDVKLRNDQKVFTQALALGNSLSPVAGSAPQDGTLLYQWK